MRPTAFLLGVAVCASAILNTAAPAPATEPGLHVVGLPPSCGPVGAALVTFDRVYGTHDARLVVDKGEALEAAMLSCHLDLLEARDDFPSSAYLTAASDRFNLHVADTALRVGYANLRLKRFPAAKAAFITANRDAGSVGDADKDDYAAALDIMRKSKAESDQLEKDGY